MESLKSGFGGQLEDVQGPHRTPPALWGNSAEHHKTGVIRSNHLLETHKAHFCSVLSEVLFPTKTETRLLFMWWD